MQLLQNNGKESENVSKNRRKIKMVLFFGIKKRKKNDVNSIEKQSKNKTRLWEEKK